MPGKARPSLIHKTLGNVERCNLSNTDKKCIQEVFARYETQQAEIENYKQIAEYQQSVSMDRHFEILRLKEEIKRLENLICFNNGERSAAE